MIRYISICLLLISSSLAEADEGSLFDLIHARLNLMDEVAAYKWLHKLPIEDLQRETIVVSNAIHQGLRTGIQVKSSRQFFRQQIHAAKEIQHYWFDYWKGNPTPKKAPDLNGVLRPALIRLSNDITNKLSTLKHSRFNESNRSQFLEDLSVKGLSEHSKQNLYDSLIAIKFYDNRLKQVLDSNKLRVGTTGDYAPFSYRESSELGYVGIDIDLAEDLAQALGVEIQIIRTTWPTLLQDLENGKYDVGMSGISRTLARQSVGYFSNVYHRGGKTPVTLCANTDRFDSLSKIDQPSTRIIVNPGGTNERFVDVTFQQAQKILHQDNRTIFDQIISGKADLMITDSIEVKLQTTRHSRLCPAMPGKTLTHLEKGFLMPQDEKLKEYVNLWLSMRKADGTFDSIFEKHVY